MLRFSSYALLIEVWFLLCQYTDPTFAQTIYKNPTPLYLSRPDINAPLFNVSILDSKRTNLGYWFLTIADPWVQPGPYIYDNEGNLVWSGFDESAGRLTTDLKVIEYLGQTCISFFRGNRQDMHAVGNGVIMDSGYRIQSLIGSQSIVGIVPDEHEFNVLEKERTALITSYHPTRYDLSEFNITTGVGWVLDSLFYEIDLQSNKIVFSWSALDHVDLSDSQFLLSQVEGTGFSLDTAWDYFHINSVEKTPEGNYLVSSRHTNCIYKISKDGGAIIWRLGGPQSSFQMDDPSLKFSYQHHARIMVENSTTTILSFLDNGIGSWPNSPRSLSYSRGLIVALNNSTFPMTARILRRFDNPDRRLAIAKGSVQRLPNGNMLMGWGQAGALSEVTPDGMLVLHARFSSPGVASYRAYKYNFTATPEDRPALWTYSPSESSPTTMFYVSWNGATEVHLWNFYTCDDVGDDDKIIDTAAEQHAGYIGNQLKKGFETTYSSSRSHQWTFAEAISIDGKSLGNSTCISTFIPSSKLRPNCQEAGCSLPVMSTTEEQVKESSNTLSSPSYFWHGFGLPPRLREHTEFVVSLMAFCLGMVIPSLWRLGVGCLLRGRRYTHKGFRRLINEED